MAFFVVIAFYPICYFAVIKKWKALALKRSMIADELEIVLNRIDDPDAEQTLIHILDWMIVKRSEAKPTLMKKMDFKPGEKAGLVRFRWNRFDAAVQAYTWAISAGQDFREKPEGD